MCRSVEKKIVAPTQPFLKKVNFEKKMSIPLCCPAVYGTQTVCSSREPVCESGSSMEHVLEAKADCSTVNKPLSEWSKLPDKGCGQKNVWVPLKSKKKGELCACNPRQLKDLQQMKTNIEARARRAGAALTWDEFNGGALGSYTDAEQLAAQQSNAGRWVTLTQADFAAGTVRLRAGGYFRLAEDIEFDPNTSESNWFDRRVPTASQRAAGALYSSDAYIRGFFAALTIEGSDIYLDLNGKKFAHSQLSRVAQRFQAVIELADQPFVPNQGPGFFGADVDAARNAVVANGTIGLSSHHGIHGNLCQNVLLESLTVEEYEVCGIALNGVSNVAISECTLEGTLQTVQFDGTLSGAIFGLQDGRALTALALQLDAGLTQLNPEYAALLAASASLSAIVEPIVTSGTVTAGPFLIGTCSFGADKEEVQVIDGNAYGILINSRGVAVNGFDEEAGDSGGNRPDSEQILICNTEVKKTCNNVNEVPALFDTREGQSGPLVDTTGAVIRFADHFDCLNQRYDISGSADEEKLIRFQLALIALRNKIASEFPDADLTRWAIGRVPDEVLALGAGNYVLACESVPAEIVWKRNGDTMFHVNKGVFGMRLDGISQLCVRGTTVTDVGNCGQRGIFCALPCEDLSASEACTLLDLDLPEQCCPLATSGDFPAEAEKLRRSAYKSGTDGGHPLQGSCLGYTGADAFGVALSGVSHFDLSGLAIEQVTSQHGSAFGLVMQYETNDGKVSCTSIDGVHAASEACEVDFSQGAKAPLAQGVRIDTSSTKITLHKPAITDVTAIGSAACRLCVNSTGVGIVV